MELLLNIRTNQIVHLTAWKTCLTLFQEVVLYKKEITFEKD